jgi:hypothetical protein
MLCPDAQARIFLESLAVHCELCIPCTGRMGSIGSGVRDPRAVGNWLAHQAEATQSRAAAMQEH